MRGSREQHGFQGYKLIIFLYVIVLLSPLLGLLWETLHGARGIWSVEAYVKLVEDPNFTSAMVESFILSLTGVAIAIIIFVPSMYVLYVYYPRWMPFLEWWTLLPFMVPGVALAIGYVSVFSSGPLPLVGTPYLLPFAFAVLGSPFFFRACYNALMGVDVRTLTEAASTLGSSPWRSFYKVILPNLTPGIINGSLLVFALGMGEFAVTQLTTGGNLITFPLYMDSIFMYNPQEGASMAFLSFFITWIALAVTIFIIPKITHRYRAS